MTIWSNMTLKRHFHGNPCSNISRYSPRIKVSCVGLGMSPDHGTMIASENRKDDIGTFRRGEQRGQVCQSTLIPSTHNVLCLLVSFVVFLVTGTDKAGALC